MLTCDLYVPTSYCFTFYFPDTLSWTRALFETLKVAQLIKYIFRLCGPKSRDISLLDSIPSRLKRVTL